MDSKSLSHTKWKCQYHIVFIPKYRKKQLYGRLKEDVLEIIATLCKWNKAFWARGYYVATVGNITETAIKKYIQEQSNRHLKWWLMTLEDIF